MNPSTPITSADDPINAQKVWACLCDEAQAASEQQPLMASYFHANVLNHDTFSSAISFFLSHHLATEYVPSMVVRDVFMQAIKSDPSIEERMLQDLIAHYTRDPTCEEYVTPLLYFKGYHAIQSYRIAHWLWQQGRTLFAYYMQSRIAELFHVDVHPAAQIAGGLMVDHATGVVIGETTVIEENVSMLHAVTLGGSGATTGKRHPTIGRGVLLSAGAKVLGGISIGAGTSIGAGSVVLESMPANSTVVGVPARVVGRSRSSMPSLDMDHNC
jgi:serine O-acetyltransferase